MKQVIFYGAGEYAKANLTKWENAGLQPLCFVDYNPAKQGTSFGNTKYNIMSLPEALSTYKNSDIYLSLATKNLISVQNYLLDQGVPKEKIRYCDNVEFRRGCHFIGTFCQAGIFSGGGGDFSSLL